MKDTSTNTSPPSHPEETITHFDDFFGPFYFEPYAIEVAKRIDPTQSSVVLEIGSGTGRVTRHIRERIESTAKLIASDIDEKSLSVAKKKLNHLDIDWQHIDAQQLPFTDNSIDLIICCFTYMFVPNRLKAFAEVYRILRPGGQFIFTTWDKLENNPVSHISRSIAEAYLETPLPDSNNQSTSMSDESIIKPLLLNAGFSKFTIEKVGLLSSIQTAKEAANGLVELGPAYEKIKKINPAWIDEIKIKVEKELSEKFGAAPMVSPISALISQANK